MTTILIVIYITAAVSMIVLILLQRSEGGALGIGGGGGGFVSGRGAANFMTRATAILATIFFITAILLGILGHRQQPSSAVVGGPAKAPAGESAACLGARAGGASAEQPSRAQASEAQAGDGSSSAKRGRARSRSASSSCSATASAIAVSGLKKRPEGPAAFMLSLKTASLPFRFGW